MHRRCATNDPLSLLPSDSASETDEEVILKAIEAIADPSIKLEIAFNQERDTPVNVVFSRAVPDHRVGAKVFSKAPQLSVKAIPRLSVAPASWDRVSTATSFVYE